MTVKLAAQFSKDERPLNSLNDLADQIAKDSEGWQGYALVKLERVRTSHEDADGSTIPTVGFKRIEILDGEEADAAAKRLVQLYEARTHTTPITGIDGQRPDADLDDGPVAQREPDAWLDNR
jgi:hypothetical protein